MDPNTAMVAGGRRDKYDRKLTINVPVVYMGRYEVVLRGDYP